MEKVIKIEGDKLFEEYDFLEGYDDVVVHKQTSIVYKVNYIDGFAQLVEVSNIDAIKNIEQGLSEFAKRLKKEMGF